MTSKEWSELKNCSDSVIIMYIAWHLCQRDLMPLKLSFLKE